MTAVRRLIVIGRGPDRALDGARRRPTRQMRVTLPRASDLRPHGLLGATRGVGAASKPHRAEIPLGRAALARLARPAEALGSSAASMPAGQAARRRGRGGARAGSMARAEATRALAGRTSG